MDLALERSLRSQLLDRRQRLSSALDDLGEAQDLLRLLKDVDAALQRMDGGGYGTCELCHESIDTPDLAAHPGTPWCLCALSSDQQGALERDMTLAIRVQGALLPPQDLAFAGWESHFRYQAAGPLSGDCLDLVQREADGPQLQVLVGDVSGKGVAASLLMARLSALFRSLIDRSLAMNEIVARLDRLFAEAKPTTHYATMVALRATLQGGLELVNAGHCRPLLVQRGKLVELDSSGFPVGLFRGSEYTTHRLALDPGDTLLLYTDGVTEARNRDEEEYGSERLAQVLLDGRELPPRRLAAAVLADLSGFRGGVPRQDDLTLLVLRRAA